MFEALVNKGNCSFVLEDFAKARDYYLDAISVEAACTEALYNLGKIIMHKINAGQPDLLNLKQKWVFLGGGGFGLLLCGLCEGWRGFGLLLCGLCEKGSLHQSYVYTSSYPLFLFSSREDPLAYAACFQQY